MLYIEYCLLLAVFWHPSNTISPRVVQLANETFGFDSWGYSVTNTTVDFVDHSNGGYSLHTEVILKTQTQFSQVLFFTPLCVQT